MPNYVEVPVGQVEVGQKVTVLLEHGCGQGGVKVASTSGNVFTIEAPNGVRHEYPLDKFFSREYAIEVEQALPASECLEYHADGADCSGPVDYHTTGSSMRAWPRCWKHQLARWEAHDNSMERYADVSSPPSWFDPSYAGERWSEDD